MSTKIDYKNSPQSDAAIFLANRIKQLLNDNKKVLWLLTGGSGVSVGAATSQLLAGSDLSNLYVTISDERYGPVGHVDENMQQLFNTGLSLPDATVYRPLSGSSIQATTAKWSTWLESAYNATDYHLALLGIGEDGHTAGIKPNSPAVSSQAAACHFEGEDFQRITVTAQFLASFDEAVVQAYGSNKQAIVQSLLQQTDLDRNTFPAGLIWDIPSVTLFTDTAKEETL